LEERRPCWLTPCSQISGLQKCEGINFYCFMSSNCHSSPNTSPKVLNKPSCLLSPLCLSSLEHSTPSLA
jgi:hypothetical protein